MRANDPFNTTKPATRTKTVRRSPIHLGDLEVASDPIPQKRSLGPGRYDELFASLKPGQCIKCEPAHTGALGNALRHWIRKQRKENLAVKAMQHYPGCKEQLGRVWLITKEQKQNPK